ncbi:MAG: hypothetical protein HFI20_06970 [Lachnospiraceae bacterium]|nr:hypothetical protein [Lachnospiraceae bacterium]
MNWYIGLDIGTTNIKACAFCSEIHVQMPCVSIPTPCIYSPSSCTAYEYDADMLFEACCKVLGQLSAHLTKGHVRSLAVSSMGESGILLDSEFHPLCRAIPWFDTRSIPQAEELNHLIGKEELYQITGQISSGKFGLTKLLWFKKYQPELFSNALHWASINDYILYRFSGKLVSDYSIASRTMAFDIHQLTWSPKILDAVSLSQSFFPEAIPGGTAIGSILPEISQKLGLPVNVSIITGGHDHACAAIGSGTFIPGSVLDSMGTSEVLVLPLAQPLTTHEMFLSQISIYPHCSGLLYRALTSMQACGASMNWFLESIGKSISSEAKLLKKNPAAHLQEIAANCETCPELLYYPFLRGSLACPEAGGVFLGIRDHHKTEHFAKALLDGLCQEFTFQLHNLLKVTDTSPHTIRVVGGPSHSSYLMQRKANFCGTMTQTPLMQEAACLGAALLASVGCGDLSYQDILRTIHHFPVKSYLPQEDNSAADAYKSYCFRHKYIEQCFSSEIW